MPRDEPRVRGVRARAVDVPMARPLATGGGSVDTVPLVLVDLDTDADVGGRSYVFAYTTRALRALALLVEALGAVIAGDTLAPAALEGKLQRTLRLLGTQGLAGMALAGLDMAAWDALGRVRGLPLARVLGGEPAPVPAYNSNGLGLIGAERAAGEAAALAAPGFGAIKVRLGYPDAETDLRVLRAVREGAPAGVRLMADYNQSLSVAEATRRIACLDGEGLDWVEEPTRCDDYAGHAAIRRKARTPIQLGENCQGPRDLARAIAAGACDLLMPDAAKIGGVTGWLRAAALAQAAGLPVSSHLYPEVSAHLLAVTPGRHWLEYVDWASPVLRDPVRVEDGHVTAPCAPGIGLEWDEDAVRRHRHE